MIKEIKQVFERNDAPEINTKLISHRIGQHRDRNNTKEHLNSWMNQRRRIDAQLDEGYHVELNEGFEKVAVYENRQNAVE